MQRGYTPCTVMCRGGKYVDCWFPRCRQHSASRSRAPTMCQQRQQAVQHRMHHVLALLVLQALHVHGLRAPAPVRKSASQQGKLESFEENVAQARPPPPPPATLLHLHLPLHLHRLLHLHHRHPPPPPPSTSTIFTTSSTSTSSTVTLRQFASGAGTVIVDGDNVRGKSG